VAGIDHKSRRIELDPAANSSSFLAATRLISLPKRSPEHWGRVYRPLMTSSLLEMTATTSSLRASSGGGFVSWSSRGQSEGIGQLLRGSLVVA
jgi:hypothetical protein